MWPTTCSVGSPKQLYVAASTLTTPSRTSSRPSTTATPRIPKRLLPTWRRNDFIKDINNEGETTNATYAKNLASLENFVMLMFDKDVTVEPKQSSWFASYPIRNETYSAQDGNVDEPTPLRQSSIYLEDRIGLKQLDRRGSLVMELCHGIHMEINPACQLKVFGKYVGTPSSGFDNAMVTSFDRTWRWMLYNVTGLRVEDTAGMVLTQVYLFLGIFLSVRLLLSFIVLRHRGRAEAQGLRRRRSDGSGSHPPSLI